MPRRRKSGGSSRDTFFDLETVGSDFRLRRTAAGPIFFLLFWAGGVACFLLLGLWAVSHVTRPVDWKIYLLLSPFVLVPLGMLALAGWIFPAQMITGVWFKTNERETRVTYLWFFRRTIRELPAKIQISGGGAWAVTATLLFAHSRMRIPAFQTDKWAAASHEAGAALAMAQTEEIRRSLQLGVETCGRSGDKAGPSDSSQASGALKRRELAELLVTAPPRKVPRELSMPVPIQGIMLGWGIVLLSLLVLWWFVPWGAWHDWWLSRSAMKIPGRVVAVSDTGWTEGGAAHHRGSPIIEYDFTFTPEGGKMVSGVSYLDLRRWRANDRVNVEFIQGSPTVARIAGARTTFYSLTFNLVGMFVPVFFIFLFVWVWTAWRRVKWLFKYGAAAEARVVAVEPTNKKCWGNWEPIYQITLQPTDAAGGPPWIMDAWQKDTLKLARERLASGSPVLLLYAPGRPKRLILPEAWLDW